jgi:hypothetical protein
LRGSSCLLFTFDNCKQKLQYVLCFFTFNLTIISWELNLPFHHLNCVVAKSSVKPNFIDDQKLSKKSQSQQLLISLGWSRSQHPLNFLASKSLGLDISVLKKSQSLHILYFVSRNFTVNMLDRLTLLSCFGLQLTNEFYFPLHNFL